MIDTNFILVHESIWSFGAISLWQKMVFCWIKATIQGSKLVAMLRLSLDKQAFFFKA